MSVKFMSGEKSSKFTIPENEINNIQCATTDIKNDIEKLKVSLELERSERYQNNIEFQTQIKSIHSDICIIRNKSEPIFGIFANIVTAKWFMFINRFIHMVVYDIADSQYVNIIYVYPVPIDANIEVVKGMNKRFRKRIKNNHIDTSKCRVEFGYSNCI